MARTVDYPKRAEKIKNQIDELVTELLAERSIISPSKRKIKPADVDFENEDVMTLMQLQARLGRIILEKSK